MNKQIYVVWPLSNSRTELAINGLMANGFSVDQILPTTSVSTGTRLMHGSERDGRGYYDAQVTSGSTSFMLVCSYNGENPWEAERALFGMVYRYEIDRHCFLYSTGNVFYPKALGDTEDEAWANLLKRGGDSSAESR